MIDEIGIIKSLKGIGIVLGDAVNKGNRAEIARLSGIIIKVLDSLINLYTIRIKKEQTNSPYYNLCLQKRNLFLAIRQNILKKNYQSVIDIINRLKT